MTVDEKLDHLIERVTAIDVTLIFQAKQLEEHIKRTQLLELKVEPIEDHVKFIQGLVKLVMLIATIASIGVALIKIKGML